MVWRYSTAIGEFALSDSTLTALDAELARTLPKDF
jgi:hypothetical protein